MKHSLKNLIEIESLLNVIYFSFEGTVVSHFVKQKEASDLTGWDLSLFAAALTKIQEAELVFENRLFYIVRGRHGFLLTVMERSAPLALIRLNCCILLPELEQ